MYPQGEASAGFTGPVATLAATMATAHVCPNCKGKVITRSVPKSAKDRLMLKLRSKHPYRCLDCNHRFYDRSLSKR